MRSIEEIKADIEKVKAHLPEGYINTELCELTAEFILATAADIPLDRLEEICTAGAPYSTPAKLLNQRCHRRPERTSQMKMICKCQKACDFGTACNGSYTDREPECCEKNMLHVPAPKPSKRKITITVGCTDPDYLESVVNMIMFSARPAAGKWTADITVEELRE